MRALATLTLTALLGSAIGATAFAADKPVLTVYTYDSFTADWGPGPKVEAAFEETCECDLQFVALADGVALLNRLRLEGDATKADVVLGLDQNLTVEARETGLFAPSGIDTSGVKVPGGFEDDTFVPYDYAHFAVILDTQAEGTPPKSLAELVDGVGDGKIIIQDPRTSTPGLGLLLWVKSVYGEDAPAAWAKLKDRVLTVTPGWSEGYGLFTKGQASMVLSYTTSPAYHLIAEETDRYVALDFPEGHPLQIEVAARTRTSAEPELASKFLAFMVSPAFQSIIPTNNWMRPAADTGEPLPEAFSTLVEPATTLSIAADEVAANRKAWIDEWLEGMSR